MTLLNMSSWTLGHSLTSYWVSTLTSPVPIQGVGYAAIGPIMAQSPCDVELAGDGTGAWGRLSCLGTGSTQLLKG